MKLETIQSVLLVCPERITYDWQQRGRLWGRDTRLYLYLFVVALTSSTCRHQRVTCSSEGQGPGSQRVGSDSVPARNVMKPRTKWLKAPDASHTDGAHRWRGSKILSDIRRLTRTLPVSHSAHALHCRQKRAESQGWCLTLTRFPDTKLTIKPHKPVTAASVSDDG